MPSNTRSQSEAKKGGKPRSSASSKTTGRASGSKTSNKQINSSSTTAPVKRNAEHASKSMTSAERALLEQLLAKQQEEQKEKEAARRSGTSLRAVHLTGISDLFLVGSTGTVRRQEANGGDGPPGAGVGRRGEPKAQAQEEQERVGHR